MYVSFWQGIYCKIEKLFIYANFFVIFYYKSEFCYLEITIYGIGSSFATCKLQKDKKCYYFAFFFENILVYGIFFVILQCKRKKE